MYIFLDFVERTQVDSSIFILNCFILCKYVIIIIYFSYDGGNIYSTCFKISTTESEFFDIDDTPVYINDHL